ncbi:MULTISPECIES: prephenate dehydrogenase/arogenate dehydrogenase family protein [Halorussus]|uniref:prephenate dehydrogenase/arogenate dehydrogenase family protein n=1 Tax=Halorussus TaxID=1070314 RepID=UPI0020A0D07D|nr:prephenate dehydrogenase/arogenate dehydrogenase family protein [Halorussus vallis]USZ76637.1 prephenate dehydrogenase/arogenate dehydrogenase family protein [Halorussus vallis]
MEVLIVGAGAMGRWFGSILDADVAFADADPAVAEAAADREDDARAVALSTDERFDAVCVAVPLSAAAEAVDEHAPKATRAVFDVTGTMAGPLAAMAEAAPDRERASFHPLFAPENAPGNVAVAVEAGGPVTDRILDRLRERGNDVVETTPEEHDEAMETVQASAHAAVLAFALAAEDVPEGLSTPVSDDLAALVEQVAGGTPRVYADIQDAFDGADRVAEAAARLADADREAFERLYHDARETADETQETTEDER